jgi:uncharacterized PurR-regulated membrane protein YhhQ (DUF165 family)
VKYLKNSLFLIFENITKYRGLINDIFLFKNYYFLSNFVSNQLGKKKSKKIVVVGFFIFRILFLKIPSQRPAPYTVIKESMMKKSWKIEKLVTL